MRSITFAAITAQSVVLLSGAPVHSQTYPAVEVGGEVHHDVSLPLRYLADVAAPLRLGAPVVIPLRPIPHAALNVREQQDGALQTVAGSTVGTTDGLNFAGVGAGDHGFSDSSAPPDTNGAVGLTQYVQQVNTSLGIFNKANGALILPVKATNALWTGFGGGCEFNNDGDGIVKYDRIANRWVITQFSVSTLPYLQCVAVSKTSDATGIYYRYAFSYGETAFIDYPKVGVWPDAYYVTYNIFNLGQTFVGAKLCALKRTAMLLGQAATQQCFQLGAGYGGVLPSDLDGATLPPTGAPNYMINFANNALDLWKMHIDWVVPAHSRLTGPVSIAVPAFTMACGGGTCIAQKGVTQRLDSLADRLMYRLAYRNRGAYESLVVDHTVKVGAGAGVRWYELRSPATTPTVFQEGTYAPDTGFRWMGSIAMDKVGDIAVGYSASSAVAYPSIRYTGRVPSDGAGRLEGEKIIKAGQGSQDAGLSRWGDYSAMTVDPVNDCTFFYTNEYLKSSGSFNWSTEINTFKFPGCH